MDSDMDVQNFFNCAQQILPRDNLSNLNATQMVDLLSSEILADINLKVKLGNCMGLGERPFSPPWWAQFAWFIVFAVMLLLAIVGNTLVIWIVLAHRRMRTVTNYFLVNLAVADLLMATLNGAPNFVFLVTAHWPFGAATCTASNFTANLTVSAGVFTLVAITVDRYVAIVKPLQHRLSRKVARSALFTVWCASALLALPNLLYSDTYKKQYINGEREICFIKWPDGSYPTSKTDYCYNLVFLAVTYVVPMSVMVWAYARMSAALRGRAIGECTHHQLQVVRAKRKVVRMFVLVVMVFALCWLPYHSYFVLVYHHQSLASSPFSQHIYLGFYWLAMANSMFNPLIYYWMSNKFQIYFRMVLCWCRPSKTETPNDLKKLDMNRSFSVSQRHYRDPSSFSRA
ncbi:tachykinin-like peptides receptor 86C isoform X1 [Plodia interpunctella]|uniref:tachykinin-like peptides receptor 86C isoform X1 n=1 Tax=Plodia interpunctella TaxID=58824 RepID=UPI0023683561|nr:tachykinin-like peptides receptor 86C isoform X1 [Plodia interpunctella]XP_053605635.1 tachykinin-like peptides receptor 86C isoform X1 [Plodia interpunctella]XP_053605636.1 tachykinin-like peptides receptor 86C isoform X1 [Plodia interpunctella]XP_053605637.1 tachykinin-like peptides receptor 86C isoform X1 [Plodia interpunctella]XP_053605639.1 tachykinin-like peptides receptor 86C isoform X1 [Plodia interpunctella]XP_053605640.1 tachykinin-like peptides receptor 86C isoform X1 [Plodia int